MLIKLKICNYKTKLLLFVDKKIEKKMNKYKNSLCLLCLNLKAYIDKRKIF